MVLTIDRFYDSIIHSPAGRMSPLIAEVSRTFPTVARAFHTEYIGPQRQPIGEILDQGVAEGAFREIDSEVFFHLVFGPIVTPSLPREMFATFDDLEQHFPVDRLRQGHRDLIEGWLSP